MLKGLSRDLLLAVLLAVERQGQERQGQERQGQENQGQENHEKIRSLDATR